MVISEETASSKWDVQKVGRKLFWVDKNSFIEGKKNIGQQLRREVGP